MVGFNSANQKNLGTAQFRNFTTNSLEHVETNKSRSARREAATSNLGGGDSRGVNYSRGGRSPARRKNQNLWFEFDDKDCT